MELDITGYVSGFGFKALFLMSATQIKQPLTLSKAFTTPFQNPIRKTCCIPTPSRSEPYSKLSNHNDWKALCNQTGSLVKALPDNILTIRVKKPLWDLVKSLTVCRYLLNPWTFSGFRVAGLGFRVRSSSAVEALANRCTALHTKSHRHVHA